MTEVHGEGDNAVTGSWTLKCPKCGSTNIQHDGGDETIKELDGSKTKVHWELERCRSCGQMIRNERRTVPTDEKSL